MLEPFLALLLNKSLFGTWFQPYLHSWNQVQVFIINPIVKVNGIQACIEQTNKIHEITHVEIATLLFACNILIV